MRKVDQLLAEYGESHQNSTNKIIHWICVPAIFFVIIGLLWEIPTPAAFSQFNFPVNFGTIGLLVTLIYYRTLSSSLTLGMIFFAVGVYYGNLYLSKLETPLWLISVVVFIIAWIFQFVGHGIEGKKPSFFKDLQFLLIGPLWLLHFIYKKLGVPY